MITSNMSRVTQRTKLRCAGFPPAAHLALASWAEAAIESHRDRRSAYADPSVDRGSI
jgi:hypothetical protein